jgi:cyclophilin family peptidyl-prolyl cis-trans isomerase
MPNRLLSTFLALALAACGASSDAADAGPTVDAAAGERYLPEGYTLTPFLSATATTHTYDQADEVLVAGKDYQAVLVTSAGRLVLDLLETDAPIAVNSFVFLARHHYFDGIAFHRVIAGFMAQSGDPNTISGAPSTWGYGGPGYAFDVENDGLSFDGPGVVGMANTGAPSSNGSQFFITFVARPELDADYTIFARLVEGMETLSAIAVGEPPAMPTRMTEVYIVEK